MKAPPSEALQVAAGLVFHQGRLLIARRRETDHQGGLWEFPGGKIQPDESFEVCLAREFREELEMDVAVGPCVEILTHVYPDRVVHLRFFRCTWVGGEPRAVGCQAFAWVKSDQLRRYRFPAADERLLDRIEAEASWWISAD